MHALGRGLEWRAVYCHREETARGIALQSGYGSAKPAPDVFQPHVRKLIEVESRRQQTCVARQGLMLIGARSGASALALVVVVVFASTSPWQ